MDDQARGVRVRSILMATAVVARAAGSAEAGRSATTGRAGKEHGDLWSRAFDRIESVHDRATSAVSSTWTGLLRDVGLNRGQPSKPTPPASTTATSTSTATSSPDLIPWAASLIQKETATPSLSQPIHATTYQPRAVGAPVIAMAATPGGSVPTSTIHISPAPLAYESGPTASPATFRPAPVPEPSGLLIAATLAAGGWAWSRRPTRPGRVPFSG